jgi:N-methylhydantoinase A/oxoprolinase/acetone carboxylase beta subunit
MADLHELRPGGEEGSLERSSLSGRDVRSAEGRSYERSGLVSGRRLEGPALIYEHAAHWCLDEGWTAEIDASGDAILRRAT